MIFHGSLPSDPSFSRIFGQRPIVSRGSMETPQWRPLLESIGFSDEHITLYCKAFQENHLSPDVGSLLNHDLLKELGMTSMGHRLKIIQYFSRSPPQTLSPSSSSASLTSPTSPTMETSRSSSVRSEDLIDLRSISPSPTEGSTHSSDSSLETLMDSPWTPHKLNRISSHLLSKGPNAAQMSTLQHLCLQVFETNPTGVFTSRSFDVLFRSVIQLKDEVKLSPQNQLCLNALARLFRNGNESIQQTILEEIGMPTIVKWTKAGQFPIFSEIDRDLLVISDKKLGKGGEAYVWLGMYAGLEVAIKQINDEDEYGLRALMAEATYMSICRSHVNVVRCYGVSTSVPYSVIMEYCALGSLRDVLRNKSIELHYPLIINLALQCAMAIQYLHSLGIIHRDIKSQNFLVSEDFTCKVTDFGISRLITHRNNTMTGLLGSTIWMAPEVYKKKPYTNKADSYSFGILLWEILMRDVPYGDMDRWQMEREIFQNKIRPTIPKDCPPEYAKLMTCSWNEKPSKRPTSSQIVQELQAIQKGGTGRWMVDPKLAKGEAVQDLELSENQRRLILETWAIISKQQDLFGQVFYGNLFQLNPTIEPLFAKARNKERMLTTLIQMIVKFCEERNFKEAKKQLYKLGARHVNYRVQMEHFEDVAKAVSMTLSDKKVLGKKATSTVQKAWDVAFMGIVHYMKIGLKDATKADPSHPSALPFPEDKKSCSIQ
eukprot:TRINITY_DN2357_c0_g1_i2.p1 TRINITY_DN2357_c0_g1~~TRINITY_DN2357_c0_g1_i2.p1  ORF type:complete len:714 (+),score=158.22 TRINITY_DN2357_c0_g1_i2:43-2184(+)